MLVVPELHFSMRKRCCVSFDVIASLAGPRRMRVAQVLVVRSCAFLDAQFCFPGMLWRRRGRASAIFSASSNINVATALARPWPWLHRVQTHIVKVEAYRVHSRSEGRSLHGG